MQEILRKYAVCAGISVYFFFLENIDSANYKLCIMKIVIYTNEGCSEIISAYFYSS